MTTMGRFQSLFEYASMMGELLEMDVVSIPNYDGYQAAATSLRMAGRITNRHEALVSGSVVRRQALQNPRLLHPGCADPDGRL